MKIDLRLRRFSQEVDLDNTNVVHYFLVFVTVPGGKEVRLPASKEQVETLTALLYGGKQESSPEPSEGAPPEEKTAEVEDPELNEELSGVLDPSFRTDGSGDDDDDVNEDVSDASQFGGGVGEVEDESPYYGNEEEEPETDDQVPSL